MSNTSSSKSQQQWIGMVVVGTLLAASPLAAGESRWYLTGKLGQASVERDFGSPGTGWRVDGEEMAASVEGGYALNRYIAVQGGYHDLGSYAGLAQPCPACLPCPDDAFCALALFAPPTPIPVEAELTGFSLSAVPRWPVTERASVYGKLGVVDWEGKLAVPVDPQLVDRPSDRDLLAGIGAQYAFPKGLGVLLEYETTDLFDTVSVGASWRF